MVKRIRCRCGGIKECKLCRGSGSFDYEVGDLGIQPFPCPNCEGARFIPNPTLPGEKQICYTCNGAGSVDPATAPSGGLWEMMRKVFFGA